LAAAVSAKPPSMSGRAVRPDHVPRHGAAPVLGDVDLLVEVRVEVHAPLLQAHARVVVGGPERASREIALHRSSSGHEERAGFESQS
jgi:hypothetical protein